MFLINAADPFSGMNLVWECEGIAHGILEHHQGYLYLFTDASKEGQSTDFHILLRSPLDSSNPRIWEVCGLTLHYVFFFFLNQSFVFLFQSFLLLNVCDYFLVICSIAVLFVINMTFCFVAFFFQHRV